MWKFTWPFIYEKLFLSDFTCFSCLAARPFVLSCDTSPPTVFQCLPTLVSTPAARAKHWEKLACVAPPLFPFLPIPYPLPLSTPATQARRNNRIIGKKWEWMLAHQHLMPMHITPCCTSLHARHIFLRGPIISLCNIILIKTTRCSWITSTERASQMHRS